MAPPQLTDEAATKRGVDQALARQVAQQLKRVLFMGWLRWKSRVLVLNPLTEYIFASGKTAACLYTNLRNPYSNCCYAKIGFKPVCPSWHYHRNQQRSA